MNCKLPFLAVIGSIFLLPTILAQLIIEADSTKSATGGGCVAINETFKCPDQNIIFTLYNRRTQRTGLNVTLFENGTTNHNFAALIDPSQPVKVIIHGVILEYMTPELYHIKNDYLKKYDCSVIIVNYEIYAGYQCYTQVLNNIQYVGSCIGQFLAEIYKIGAKNIHLVTYSLGCHLANYIAKAMVPYRIARITALDPPTLYVEDDHRLDITDADFVDAFYTSALSVGPNRAHAGFYFNGGVIQPGCVLGTCSHSRAVMYYRESILSTPELGGFYGVLCENYFAYMFGLCEKEEVVGGDECQATTKGMYFVQTNGDKPFAKGRSQLRKKNSGRDENKNPYANFFEI